LDNRLFGGDFNFKLKSKEGLDSLPLEIKEKKVKDIIPYILMLNKGSDALYRTKVMVVGYEKVGKTSLIETMLPIKQVAKIAEEETSIELVGKKLTIFSLSQTIDLPGLKAEETSDGSLTILQGSKSIVTLTISDPKERASFFHKVKRITLDARTHGIDIHHHEKKIEEGRKLELSVWDFGGQEEYYNNHHYFLSARSIFLVVWNATEGEKGIKGLRFWLNSLKAHLPPPPSREEKPLYSIVVVGTHIDSMVTPEKTKKINEEEIRKLFVEVGHPVEAFIYREVSSKTREGIEELLSLIEKLALSHRYMGETVPSSFLKTEELILELREKFQRVPTISMEEFLSQLEKDKYVSAEEGREAINLLHAWGTCVHFGTSFTSSLLSKYLVLDPSFLTKEILSNLFNPDFAGFILDGKLKHERLKSIWEGFKDQSEFLVELLESFEVCFQIRNRGKEENDEKTKPFWERESIVPAYLPEHPPKEFGQLWQEERPSDENEIKRTYLFNILPKELVNRLHVRLNHMMESSTIWRGGFFLESMGVKVLVRAYLKERRMELIVRGAYLEIAKSIMEDIHQEIMTVSANYPGVTSEHEEVKEIPQGTPIPWWNISGEGFDKTKDEAGGEIGHLLLYSREKSGFANEQLGKKLEYSLWHLGTSLGDIEEAYCISNQESQTMFNSFRVNLAKKLILNPQLFKRSGWKSLRDQKERQDIIDWFRQLAQHPWSKGDEVFCLCLCLC